MNLPLNTGLDIAILGGTFDPIHKGHLRIVEKLASRFDLIMVIPSGQPQLKAQPVSASAKQRLAMCEAALSDLPESISSKVVVNDVEIERIGATYTYDTLHQLRGFFPRDRFTLVIGSDAASQMGQWKRSKDLPQMANILVVRRPGVAKSEFPEIEIDALEISATQIREAITQNSTELVEEYLSPAVIDYIKSHHLYPAENSLNRKDKDK